MSTLDSALQSLFVVAKDNVTGKTKMVALPSDVQIGLTDNPADLILTGRLSLATKVYITDASGIINVSSDDTIVGISLGVSSSSGRLRANLPSSPRDGEIHIFKDVTLTSITTPIDVWSQGELTIDGQSYVTLSDVTGSLALVYFSGNWRRLSAPAVTPTNPTFFISTDANTQLYWPFDEPAGSYQFTSKGTFVSTLASVNSAHVTAGQAGIYGLAVAFDGTSGQALVTGSNTQNIGTSNFTISAWFYPTQFGSFGGICYKKYLNDASWASPYVAYGIALNNSADGRVQYSLTTAATLLQIYSNNDTGGKAQLNQWNHVVMTYNGSVLVGYLNGVEVCRSSKTGTVDFGTNGNWMIGGDLAGDMFYGSIDEVRIEPITWNASYIATMYRTGQFKYYVNGATSLLNGITKV